MDFKKHLQIAWSTTLSRIVPLVIVTLVMLVVSSLSFGLLAPVTMAGYTQSMILLLRERREPKVQDLFSHMNLFLSLFGFSLLAFLVLLLSMKFFVAPGLVVGLALAFFCLYVLPLMTDAGLGIVEAVKESYAMAMGGNVADHIAVAIIAVGIMMVGGWTMIGALFTQPLATLFLVSVYLERRGKPATPPPPPPPPQAA